MGNLQSSLDKLKEALGIVRPSEELAKAAEAFIEDNAAYMESKTKETEEWVWIEGYKGMDKDMRCRDFQYEIGKRYDMPEDAVIEVCESGFHFCRHLRHVYQFYALGGGNRFFKVRGLVKSEDDRIFADKLAAKSIEIIAELTRDELLEDFGADKWDEKYKDMFFDIGYKATVRTMSLDKLMDYGYSLPFANYLIDAGKYNVAKAVGSQPDLSMDMKVLMIMNSK
jgi:hypothetical protein